MYVCVCICLTLDTGPNVGHVIIKEGLVNKSFYWIETGSIRVEKRLGEKTLTLSTMTRYQLNRFGS